MPFSSVIDAGRRLVVTTGTGVITGDEGIDCCRQLKQQLGFNPAFDQLLDLTAATRFDATTAQLQMIATMPLFSATSRRAIVASNPTIFGLARMFESYRGLYGVGEHVRVFRDMNDAVAWLEVAA
jgi:hypothetical protein